MHRMSMKFSVCEDGNAGCRMVCGGAHKILSEFEQNFRDVGWASKITQIAREQNYPDEFVSEVIGLQVELLMHGAASYYRRIVRRCDQ